MVYRRTHAYWRYLSSFHVCCCCFFSLLIFYSCFCLYKALLLLLLLPYAYCHLIIICLYFSTTCIPVKSLYVRYLYTRQQTQFKKKTNVQLFSIASSSHRSFVHSSVVFLIICFCPFFSFRRFGLKNCNPLTI